MKNPTSTNYLSLIQKIKNNPYLYISIYKDAKAKLSAIQFQQLQQNITL